MSIKMFLQDPDLEFLAKCSNEDLKVFADLLVYSDDDKPRISESLSKDRVYKENYPNNLRIRFLAFQYKNIAEPAYRLTILGGIGRLYAS